MTPATEFVKQSMLKYPSIFPTRLKVLEHALVVLGNGLEWQEDGTIEPSYDEKPGEWTNIRLDDLHDRIKWFEERMEAYNSRAEGEPSNYDSQKYYRDGIKDIEKEIAERIERQNNIDVVAATPDPNGKTGGHYGALANIIADLSRPNYTGKPYLKLWNIPKNVEASWWAASTEVVHAAINASNSPDDRQYMRLLWDAMTDFVEGRAEEFIIPTRPETHQERVIRLDAVEQSRRDAYEQVKDIERVINRAGYTLDMKSKHRSRSHRSNGTFSRSDYYPRILTTEVIAKIDKAMLKRGFTRTDDAMRPTWENGMEHRVALRLIPYVFEGLYVARILIIGYPEDENSNDTRKRAYFGAAQRSFDEADLGMYKEPESEQPTLAPVSERKIYQVVPGSLEVDGSTVTGGVHTGPSEWQVENLRYVRADLSTVTEKERTLVDILSETYDNTVGCLLQGGFKWKP